MKVESSGAGTYLFENRHRFGLHYCKSQEKQVTAPQGADPLVSKDGLILLSGSCTPAKLGQDALIQFWRQAAGYLGEDVS